MDARPSDPADSSDLGRGRVTAVACLAVFADAPGARQAEQLLGRLCANGLVDVLDGTLIDQSTGGRLSWRPLENLPRLAALPEPAWAALTEELAGHLVEPRRLPLPLAATWPPGGSAVLVFCACPSADLAHELRGAGASVTDTPIKADHYAALRHGGLQSLADERRAWRSWWGLHGAKRDHSDM